MVTIDVSEDVWRHLQLQKNPGDSFNDVLKRELGIEDKSTKDETESGGEREEVPPASTSAQTVEELEDWPNTKEPKKCRAAVNAAVEYVQENGRASMREIVSDVMPEHDLGYQVPELEEGERYRGSWWRKVVKPGLEADSRVEKPSGGGEWCWSN